MSTINSYIILVVVLHIWSNTKYRNFSDHICLVPRYRFPDGKLDTSTGKGEDVRFGDREFFFWDTRRVFNFSPLKPFLKTGEKRNDCVYYFE